MKIFILAVCTAFFFSSCLNLKEVEKSYQLFQTGFDSSSTFAYKPLKLKQGDAIVVQTYSVASANQEQVGIFNLPGAGNKAATYTLNNLGMIDLPKLGTFKADGLTCKQIKDTLTAEWGKYVRDLSVDVQLTGFSVNVLGEVPSQGVKLFKNERANIFDAIGAAGGLGETGKRNDIMVVREDSGKRTSYFLDITNAKIYQSPAFQLLQNDVVYVGANDRKFRQIRNSNLQQTVLPLSQIASIGIAVANMILIIFAIRR